MSLIKPGISLSLVVSTNDIRKTNDIRGSTLHDISGGKLILTQTDPPLLSTQLNQSIIISFLTKEREKPVRYGFHAQVIEFINEFRLSSFQTAPVIVVLQKSVPEHFNLRMFYRIHPSGDFGLQLFMNDQLMGIVDISIGGALIGATLSQNRECKFMIGKIIKITLVLDEVPFNIKAQIKRISFPDNQKWSPELVFIALQFCDPHPELDQSLGRKILNLKRKLLSNGLEP
jgi:sulfur relay (sulfurtransferase) DsrC/TusE family protein